MKTKQPKTLYGWEWETYRAVITAAFLISALAVLAITVERAKKASPEPSGSIKVGNIDNLASFVDNQGYDLSSNILFGISEKSTLTSITTPDLKMVGLAIFSSKDIAGTSRTHSPINLEPLLHEIGTYFQFSNSTDSSGRQSWKRTYESMAPSAAKGATVFLIPHIRFKELIASKAVSFHLVDYSAIGGSNKDSKSILGQTIEPVVKEVVAQELPFCYDPIACIRDVGEELGVSNRDIMTMIRIAKAESSLNPRAKNPKSTASGLFQIVAGTWYSNDCVGDKWDYEDNTRCAYRIYQKRGFQPWNASKRVWYR